MFLDTSRGSFSVCLHVSDCVSLFFVCSEHVGTNSLRTTNEQLPYHQSRLSRLCELYYNRYLHTLRGLHVCVHIQPHVRTSLLQTATVEEQLHQRQLSLISLYLRHLSLAFLFLTSVTSDIFFFVCLFPCASPSLFLTQSVSHLYLSLLYLPAREILLQREVMFFVLFSSPISGEFTFSFFFFEMPPQRIHITGSSPSTNLKNPVPPSYLHPHPIHQTAASQPHRLLPHFS